MQVLHRGQSEWVTYRGDRDPPLGSISLLSVEAAPLEVLCGVETSGAAPWVPIFVSGARNVADAFRRVTHFPRMVVETPRWRPSPEKARVLVGRVVSPTAAAAAGWLAKRLELRAGTGILPLLLGGGSEAPSRENRDPWLTAGMSRQEFCRRAEEFKPLLPGDWRRLRTLTCRISRAGCSLEHLAFDLGIGIRALRYQVQRLLGCSVEEYRHTPGWAWVLEAALRRHRYINLLAPDHLHA